MIIRLESVRGWQPHIAQESVQYVNANDMDKPRDCPISADLRSFLLFPLFLSETNVFVPWGQVGTTHLTFSFRKDDEHEAAHHTPPFIFTLLALLVDKVLNYLIEPL